jgi:hypothetical protein
MSPANLPTCGGDARQGRGGYHAAERHPASHPTTHTKTAREAKPRDGRRHETGRAGGLVSVVLVVRLSACPITSVSGSPDPTGASLGSVLPVDHPP